jgi:hypothetical protein
MFYERSLNAHEVDIDEDPRMSELLPTLYIQVEGTSGEEEGDDAKN